MHDLKQLPTVEPEIDKCIECGYCEPRCPSRDLTLTPRQRIVVRREMARQQKLGGSELFNQLERDFPYMALDTCAADGLCATTCPVSIDTGKLVKRFRALAQFDARKTNCSNSPWMTLRWWKTWCGTASRIGHLAEHIIGVKGMQAITGAMRKVIGPNMPLWSAGMPYATKGGIPLTERAGAKAVYFPACISRTMGRLPGERSEMSLMQATVARGQARGSSRLDSAATLPETAVRTPYSSKGFEEARDAMLNRVIGISGTGPSEGALPIMVDTSPCTYGLLHAREYLTPENQERFDHLDDCGQYRICTRPTAPPTQGNHPETSVALHPVCSAVKMGLAPKLEAIARKCSGEGFVPASLGCCAFAGDRGFMYPELTASATAGEAAEIKAHKHDGCYSSSRTCEIGMTRSTGEVYRSYIYLLEKVTRK